MAGMGSLELHTSDGQRLAADVAEPGEAVRGAVVLCHPHPLFGGNRFHPVIDALFGVLPGAGFTTLRFDFRSEHGGGIAERLDIAAALDHLSGTSQRLFVVGYSFGAAVGLATDDQRVAGIVAIAPPLSPQTPPPTTASLVLTPRHDQYCSPDAAAAIVAAWPDGDFGVIEGADHFLVGRAATVAERSAAWLVNRVGSLS
jgi:alpha/beta superfamily hydrolase